MEFSGTFELEDATVEEVWLALSDPDLVWHALPGCAFLVRVDDDEPDFEALREEYADAEPELTLDETTIQERAFEEGATYAALMEVSLGSVSPSFRTVGTIDEREPHRMVASGEGQSGNSSFEGGAEMALEATDDGVAVDWQAEADVFGRIAQMGQRVVNPAANRIIKRFFDTIQETLADLAAEDAAAEEPATAAEETAGGEPDAAVAGAAAGEAGDAGAPGDGEASDGATGGLWARIKRLLGIGG